MVATTLPQRRKGWAPWEQGAWLPPPEITIDQWAEENVVLPRAVSAEPGPVNLDRTPYLREVLQAVTDPEVTEITLCFSTQVGKTTACMLPVLFHLDQDPWPCLHVMPREEDAVALNVDRYQKIIEASPNLARHLTGAANDMTREAIRINGTALTFIGANSPAALSSRAICILVLDETDKYPPFSGQESDPIALARERTRTFISNRKIIKVSTPTTERGYIWREYQQSDRRRYRVPCLHCGRRQVLVMGNGTEGSPGIHLPPGERDPEKIVDLRMAWYECECCHRRIDDTAKPMMLRRGVWVPHGCEVSDSGEITGSIPPRRLAGYHLSALYSPWLTWSEIIAEFLRSKPYQNKLMNFRNSWQAEIWEDVVEELRGDHLRAKAKVSGYELGTVDPRAHILTAGVDVQGDHFWYVIRAWGKTMESWLVRCGRVERWEDLDTVLFRSHYFAHGTQDIVPLRCVMIDARYRKNEVFDYCASRKCQAIMGHNSPSRPLQDAKYIHPDGTVSPLKYLDTSHFKERLHRLVRAREGEPGAWRIPTNTPEDYISHLTSEQRFIEVSKKTGQAKYLWKNPTAADNHQLDAEVYALAAADAYEVEHRFTEDPRRGPSAILVVPTEVPMGPTPQSKSATLPVQQTQKRRPPRFQRFKQGAFRR